MAHLRTNMLLQFSVTSFLLMFALAAVLSIILSERLDRNVQLLEDHGAVMRAGGTINEEDSFSIPSLQGDVNDLWWITFGAIGAGFAILYGSLVMIVWTGSRTIKRQQSEIEEHATRQVEALNRLLQDRINILFSEVRSALNSARANPAFGTFREYREIVEEVSILVGRG